jgi:hypothetical protein
MSHKLDETQRAARPFKLVFRPDRR